MKNLLIASILKAWDKAFLWNEIHEYKYRDLAFEIVNLSTMLDSLKIKNLRIILSAKDSFHWVVVYLTAIINDIPITLISPKYIKEQRVSYINESFGNILFTDNENKYIVGNIHLKAAVGIDEKKGYRLFKYQKIKDVPKKWRTLNAIRWWSKNRGITPTLFEKLMDKTNKWSNTFSLGVYSSGVDNEPMAYYLGDRTLYQASRGMIKKMCELGLTRKAIEVKASFTFFSTVTILAIIGGRGTIALTRFGERKNKIKGLIGETQYFENMWDYFSPFMVMQIHRWLEKWELTKWINTRILKRWFKEEIAPNCKTFFILNDETRSRLKDNLKRVGYKVVSTYGVAQTGQLVSIDGQLIKGIEIKFHPVLNISSIFGDSLSNG